MQSTEGIVLRTTPFEEHSFISTLFTKHFGIVSVIKRVKKEQMSISPLVKIELTLRPTSHDLWKAKDIIITTSYPNLRTSLEAIQLAALMLKRLSMLLPFHEPHDEVYVLFDTHLKLLGSGSENKAIACSFFVHLYYLEGLLSENHQSRWLPLFRHGYTKNIERDIVDEILTLVTRDAKGGT